MIKKKFFKYQRIFKKVLLIIQCFLLAIQFKDTVVKIKKNPFKIINNFK